MAASSTASTSPAAEKASVSMSRTALEAYIDRLSPAPHEGSSLRRVGPRRVAGSFYGAELGSVFQPVYATDGTVAGHAAYVRSHAGEGRIGLSPWQVFSLAASDEELVRLDRLCRTLHAVNYFADAEVGWWLHLAVEHRLLTTVLAEHGRTFEGVLRAFGIATSRVVIELPAPVADEPALLAEVLSNYRHRGYAVAVRVRGGRDALATIAPFRPDVVRIRSREVSGEPLRRMIDDVHAFGGLALVDHVETAALRVSAQSSGADLVQGTYLGAPEPKPSAARPGGVGHRTDRIDWLNDSALLIGAAPLI
jgi:EAL domain-containing protein (putative c-di-GMP-specific phosphodiesterase class I)